MELTPGIHTFSFPINKYEKYAPINIACITFREFNADSVKLADTAFAANGAHHLELGDYGYSREDAVPSRCTQDSSPASSL